MRAALLTFGVGRVQLSISKQLTSNELGNNILLSITFIRPNKELYVRLRL